ncbi:uncharacterized protein CANTADRAFT_58054 [Suhomyces tanzawaensis NRRL Y-17324]|uniref:Uncharacterized protein n=1 Tax=Suhomyces tanzawaensis NRRL Y-17324 TaxID=984487 RepID=A0A1E4SB00_9ASCO|nr:uncharacterized protein CANTADRAFT_58054 [Suhomyces tanzawaensis NRRL Y-17324]ODV76700.1 hypothetical protein CANTADRAFT_58054 [Suhomyces tanzawaensis NRRL Y-17324]
MSSPIPTNTPEPMSIDEYQETILAELNMILTTVKQIDSNLVKSIGLLEESVDIQKNGQPNLIWINDSLTYKEMVVRNVQALSDVLKMLDAIEGEK